MLFPKRRKKPENTIQSDREFLAYDRTDGFKTVEAESFEMAVMTHHHLIIIDDINNIEPVIRNTIYNFI